MNGEKNRYVSVLKQKAGELGGVHDLAAGVWDNWNPLFELLCDNGDDPATVVEDAIGKLSHNCRNGAVVFIDFDGVDFLTANQIQEILDRLVANGLNPVPTVTVSSNLNVRTAVLNFIGARNRCAGVRLFFSEPGANTAANINALVADTALDVAASHLFFDLEFIDSDLLPTIIAAFPAIVGLLPNLMQWRTATLSGTGFPRILDIVGGGNAEIPRTEWEFFNTVRGQFSERVRRLDFGDYAVTHPELIEGFDPIRMQVSPKVIYTTNGSWIAFKGRSSRGRGFGATHAMCADLIQRPEFLGGNYSAGDQYIADCAQQQTGPGNSQTWKRVGTNHHITFVAEQVANLP